MSLGDILIMLLAASEDEPVLAAATRLEVRHDAGIALVFAKAAETSEVIGAVKSWLQPSQGRRDRS